MRILLIEDDEIIGEGIKLGLSKQNMAVDWFTDGKLGASAPDSAQYDAVILDLSLPGMDGLAILCQWRQSGNNVPVLILTARGTLEQRVEGLNLGADDYVAKPFGVLELTARVNALLRRSGGNASLVRGNLSLDEETMTATLRGTRLELNNKEFNLLKYLMQKEGKALTRENILNAVWGYDEGETRTVDNHVARLRKLGIDYIETVFGVGYKFVYRE